MKIDIENNDTYHFFNIYIYIQVNKYWDMYIYIYMYIYVYIPENEAPPAGLRVPQRLACGRKWMRSGKWMRSADAALSGILAQNVADQRSIRATILTGYGQRHRLD